MKARQGRYANIKTVLPLSDMLAEIHKRYPDAAVVGATHDEPEKVRHCHIVVRFVGVTRWTALAEWLHDHDGHEYAEPAGSWRRSVRYLLHLDNPEKCRIPREALQSVGIDESELSQLLGSAKLPILESLIMAERLPLHERFAFLVLERGHQPSEVSAALRCMLDLERWHDTRTCRGLARDSSALPSAPPFPAGPGRSADGAPNDCEDLDFADFGGELPEIGFGSVDGTITEGETDFGGEFSEIGFGSVDGTITEGETDFGA